MPEKRGLEEESGASEETAGVKRVCPEPENGRPGDWLCPGCQHHNWSFRDVCQKCFTNKEGVKTAEAPQKPGDWNCPQCAHLNFAFRGVCHRCQTPKPFSAGQGPPGSSRPGDWTCPTCGDLVYASRFACRKCNTPKMMAGAGGGYPGYGMDAMGGMPGAMGGMPGMPMMPNMMGGPKPGAPPKETRPGDWSCPKCFDINYASRSVCRLCNTPKSMAGGQDPSQMAQMYGYGDMSQMQAYGDMYGAFTMGVGGPPAGGQNRRAGDWDCPNCGDVVYATRSECRKCKTSKPEHLGPATSRASNPNFARPMNGGLGPSRRAGDWDCPACGDVQYASRTECRKCRTAKPE